MPRLVAEHGPLVVEDLRGVDAVSFAVEGSTWTYLPSGEGVDVVEGAVDGATVVHLDPVTFSELVHEQRTSFGLLFAGDLARFDPGRADTLLRWEPALRALWHGRPIWTADGVDAALPSRPFAADDDPAHIGARVRDVGYALVRGVFTPDEVAAMVAEVERLTAEAIEGDRRSWWGRREDGSEVCCRLLYTSEKSPVIHDLLGDGRLDRLVAGVGLDVRVATDRLDGYSCVMKPAGVVEGLADLPWHHDCGLGGHSVMCPLINVGVYLDEATPETGQLQFLADSHLSSTHPFSDVEAEALPTEAIAAQSGDVTLHYGDAEHRAASPTGAGGRRTLYATYVQERAFSHIGPGEAYNDLLFADAGDDAVFDAKQR